MTRRLFFYHSVLATASLAVVPRLMVSSRRPALWIVDSEVAVTQAVQLVAQRYGFADVQTYTCKQATLEQLRAAVTKPTFLVTDYWSGLMRGAELIRLARNAAPATKFILFSAVVSNVNCWNRVVGLDATRPDAIVEKPNVRKLIATLGAMA